MGLVTPRTRLAQQNCWGDLARVSIFFTITQRTEINYLDDNTWNDFSCREIKVRGKGRMLPEAPANSTSGSILPFPTDFDFSTRKIVPRKSRAANASGR